MKRRQWWIVALVVAVVLGATAVASNLMFDRGAIAERQSEVANRGAQVMPFDLERTTHRFIKTATGGVQTIVADDPSDVVQITLIREHLTKEAAKFRQGDFGDPEFIHGSQMPGLAELSTGYRRITTEYAEIRAGARITYSVADPALLEPLHAWFDAQVSDHGNAVEHG